MRDIYFYPLALLVVAIIVIAAILPGMNRATQNQQNIQLNGFELSAGDLGKLTAAPTTFAEFVTDPEGSITHARIYGNMPRDMAPASAGVFGTMSSGYLRVFAGQSLEIRVRARKSSNSRIDKFDLGIFTQNGGSSGWKRFSLTNEYKDYSFLYSAPDNLSDKRISYVGIWPGDEGDSQAMDVISLSVKIIQP